ncbi:hypothetical protein BgiBS90_012952, partial [Biomphalaria glabrata]
LLLIVYQDVCLDGLANTATCSACVSTTNVCRLEMVRKTFSCLPGFFGQQCQNKDLIMTSTVSQEEMKVRSVNKCQQNFIPTSPLTIPLDSSTRISRIQIEAVSNESLKGIEITFEQTSSKCYVGHCVDRRDILVGDDTLIIICNIPDHICLINISFKEVTNPRQWCAVFVGS